VGLSLAEIRRRFPHELSGGQLQRVAIARALISEPSLLVADEPVSMVDASLRMSIVNLFRTLRDDLGVSIIYITHDLATAYYISDRIIIMRKGEVVESGPARSVLDKPKHPYSQLLKDSLLSPDPSGKGVLTGSSPAVRQVRAGTPIVSPSVVGQLIRQVRGAAPSDRSEDARRRAERLTDREREVATAVGAGASNAEIAADLHMSVATVKAHISRIFTKLEAANRVQVAICMHDAGEL
jgi:ABC-type multidrug transport system ATPase subunit